MPSFSLLPSAPAPSLPWWRRSPAPDFELRLEWRGAEQAGPRHGCARVELGEGGANALALRARRPVVISCQSGRLWLTLDRDPRDYVLEAGEQLPVRTGDHVVVLGMRRGIALIHPS